MMKKVKMVLECVPDFMDEKMVYSSVCHERADPDSAGQLIPSREYEVHKMMEGRNKERINKKTVRGVQ
ncbi:hypothetical protein PJI16_13225 [Nitrospira sp. MA-1]|nr:hypothetical protein [Nitrospira sp. MA-1]